MINTKTRARIVRLAARKTIEILTKIEKTCHTDREVWREVSNQFSMFLQKSVTEKDKNRKLYYECLVTNMCKTAP